MDTFPDLGALSDNELKELIQQLTEEEQEVSYKRRILHGKIDILRAELVNRLRKKHEEGESVISGADVQQLTDILAGKGIPADVYLGESWVDGQPSLILDYSRSKLWPDVRDEVREVAPGLYLGIMYKGRTNPQQKMFFTLDARR